MGLRGVDQRVATKLTKHNDTIQNYKNYKERVLSSQSLKFKFPTALQMHCSMGAGLLIALYCADAKAGHLWQRLISPENKCIGHVKIQQHNSPVRQQSEGPRTHVCKASLKVIGEQKKKNRIKTMQYLNDTSKVTGRKVQTVY